MQLNEDEMREAWKSVRKHKISDGSLKISKAVDEFYNQLHEKNQLSLSSQTYFEKECAFEVEMDWRYSDDD